MDTEKLAREAVFEELCQGTCDAYAEFETEQCGGSCEEFDASVRTCSSAIRRAVEVERAATIRHLRSVDCTMGASGTYYAQTFADEIERGDHLHTKA